MVRRHASRERIPRRKMGLIPFALVVLVVTSIQGVGAWETEYHPLITRQAVSVLPDALKTFLTERSPQLLAGVVEPDQNRVDDHKLPVGSLTGGRPPSGGADAALQKFARQAEEMIRAGDDAQKIAFVLGQASHFIQDLNVPLHAVSGESKQQHAAFEGIACFVNWPGEQYGYRGFFLVKNYKCVARETAERSAKYAYDALKPSPPRGMIEQTWNDAVNDTANLLQSIFYRALGPEKSQALYSIPIPKGLTGKGWLCGL